MIFPPIALQMSNLREFFCSERTLGFLTGVACSFLILLVCWLVEFSRRMRRKNQVLRVKQADGSELVLTYKAVRSHVSLMLKREFPTLTLKGIDIFGDAAKGMRLHVVAMEGINLAEVRQLVCDRLMGSFRNELGLADSVKGISIDVEEFRENTAAEAVRPSQQQTLSLEVPDLTQEEDPSAPADVTPPATVEETEGEDEAAGQTP